MSGRRRPLVAVFDWNIVRTSPAGSVVRQQIGGLAAEFDVVAFTGRLDNPDPERISFVRVPLPPGPSFVKDTLYPYVAALAYWAWRRRHGRADLIQATQGQFHAPDVAYAHSCHRTYLQRYWRDNRLPGLRRLTGRVVHEHNAARERWAFSRARTVVVPSEGLRRDIVDAYPEVGEKIVVIPNPVEVDVFRRPSDFDVEAARSRIGLDGSDIVFVLVALGNFAHKGLDILLRALADIGEPRAKVLVVGGSKGEVALFRRTADSLELGSRVVFVGLVSDVRPYLWSANAFVLPSAYEGFPLVALQAAAAGLPLVATRVNGLEEILRDDETGWYVARTSESVAQALRHVIAQPPDALERIAAAALCSVERFDVESFILRWRGCYRRLARSDEDPAS